MRAATRISSAQLLRRRAVRVVAARLSAPTASAPSVRPRQHQQPASAALFSSLSRPNSTPPALPAPSFIEVDGKCVIEYVDVAPSNAGAATEPAPTLVMIHGAPGTYRDFRHIIPLLSALGVRVLGINLPGFGDSHVLDTANYYDHVSALPSMHLTYRAVGQILQGEDKGGDVFVLGHSFGGHAAVHFTGIDAERREVGVKGLALLASAGHRPHKALLPSINALIWRMLRSGVPPVEHLAKVAITQLYTRVLKFPARGFSMDYFAAGIARCASADFALFNAHLERNAQLPAFVAWAKDDAFIEEEIFEAVSAQCRAGPRLAFERGGHNIQKTKAALLADELHQWMRSVADGSHAHKYQRHDVQLHP